MVITKTISHKGQVVVPKEIRTMLNIDYHDQIEWVVEDGVVKLQKPEINFLDLAGSLKPNVNKKISVDKSIEKAREEYTKKLADDFKLNE